MRLHDLKPAPGSRKNRKVIGRGSGSGHGKTSCKGHKGQNSRSGPKRVPGFEGGQMPIHRRLPKRGFTNLFRVEYQPINIKRLEQIKDVTEFNLEAFIKLGIAGKKDKVKVLGFGDISRAITVSAHRFSKSAKEKIEAAGGKALEI
ncbi:MAG: 50S ribosomal protein L15 [Nitrospinota bacterium]